MCEEIKSLREDINKRLDLMREDMDKRFDLMHEEMNKRFETLTTRIDHFMIWSFATSLSLGGIVIAAIKFLS